MTADEKRERRQEHAARIGDALDALVTPEGVAAWLEARELNPDLSPCNQALIAQQAPGRIVGTLAAWRRSGITVSRGQTGALFLTAPGFWPKPAFTAAQTDAPPELRDPDPVPVGDAEGTCNRLRRRFEHDGRKGSTLTVFAAELDGGT